MAEALRYKDKVTIVTGGSKGIGKGCVHAFVQHGSHVVYCDRGENDGKTLETEMNTMGPGTALFIKCDVAQEKDIQVIAKDRMQDMQKAPAGASVLLYSHTYIVYVKVLVAKTIEKYGQIDCVINNAGAHPPELSIDQFSGDDFRQLLETNLVSYFLVAKYTLPHLRKTRGNIIQVSSLITEIGQLGATTYIATKGGISSLTKALAIDEAVHGVRVNTFTPGNIWTPMWDDFAKSTDDYDGCVKAGKDAQLLGRFGAIEEAGKTCLFLAADATFCTGISMQMSGGAELSYGYKNPKAK